MGSKFEDTLLGTIAEIASLTLVMALIAVLALSLGGCATTAPAAKLKPGEERAAAECRYEAEKATAGGNYNAPITGALDELAARRRLQEQCMALRGFK